MSKKKPASKEKSIIRSSAAEYLTFVAAGGSGGLEAIYADENVWLGQKILAYFTMLNHTHDQLPLKKSIRG